MWAYGAAGDDGDDDGGERGAGDRSARTRSRRRAHCVAGSWARAWYSRRSWRLVGTVGPHRRAPIRVAELIGGSTRPAARRHLGGPLGRPRLDLAPRAPGVPDGAAGRDVPRRQRQPAAVRTWLHDPAFCHRVTASRARWRPSPWARRSRSSSRFGGALYRRTRSASGRLTSRRSCAAGGSSSRSSWRLGRDERGPLGTVAATRPARTSGSIGWRRASASSRAM